MGMMYSMGITSIIVLYERGRGIVGTGHGNNVCCWAEVYCGNEVKPSSLEGHMVLKEKIPMIATA